MSRPRVVVLQQSSVDGRVAFTSEVPMLQVYGKWQQIMGAGAGLWVELAKWLEHTHNPQVWLEGSGSFVPRGHEPATLRAFEGDTAALYEDFLPRSVLEHPERRSWGVVVDSRGLGRDWPEWVGEGAHSLVLVARRTPCEYLAHLRRGNIPYLLAGEQRVDLAQALQKLEATLGVTCVCASGGGKINGALLRAGLVDEVNLLVFPAIVGGTDTPALFDSPDLGVDDWPTRLRLIATQVFAEGCVWLRYEVVGQ